MGESRTVLAVLHTTHTTPTSLVEVATTTTFDMSALPPASLASEHCVLHTPTLSEVAVVLQAGLATNFAEAAVDVVDCPDLRTWGLAARGLSGHTRLLDIGSVHYLAPTVRRDRLYDMRDYPQLTGLPAAASGLVIGAGAGPWPHVGRNSEMMPNLLIEGSDRSVAVQGSRITYTEDGNDSSDAYCTQPLPNTETRNALLGNLFISEGKPGRVLRIHARSRTSGSNFVTCLRETLTKHYRHGPPVGLGGVFRIEAGRVRVHVMPDFSPCPLTSVEAVTKWLKFHEVNSPFTALLTLISHDPGLDLTMEHSHGWGEDGSGGHYHYDTTPEDVKYLGYYNLAEYCYRIDKPTNANS